MMVSFHLDPIFDSDGQQANGKDIADQLQPVSGIGC
jgi:hypothetical protein